MKRAEGLQPLSREHLAALAGVSSASRRRCLAIRREVLRLQAGELSIRRIHRLGDLLHDHVRFEERVLFVAAEEALDASSLARLATAIDAAEAEGRSPGAPRTEG